MSTDDPNGLEFRGKDLQECERFIASINKRAHAEGKLRDDQWIADLVAICLSHEALIWWSLLDEETQGSWRLLRQAMISRFRPLFHGKSGVEAEDFVYQIRQRALHVGKLNDSHWTAEFASGCFSGSALRWYMSLDSEVRDDWILLQQAIVAQYSQGCDEVPLFPTVPTPALAAAAPAATRARLRGRIKVCRDGDPSGHYVSKNLQASIQRGRVTLTRVVTEALEVECELPPTPEALQTLSIPDGQIKGYDVLGMKWSFVDTTRRSNFLAVCTMNSSSGTASLGREFAGPLLTKLWRVSRQENGQATMPLLAMNGSEERLLSFSSARNTGSIFFAPMSTDGDIDVELLFESV